MTPLVVPKACIAQTLSCLQAAGRRPPRGEECVVLWIGDAGGAVVEVFEPAQEASEDFFKIPQSSMQQLMSKLQPARLRVLAQVHSHPQSAFHSPADDHWAIVRHLGALSLVVPWFAQRTTVESFVAQTAVFQLSRENTWDEVGAAEVVRCYGVAP